MSKPQDIFLKHFPAEKDIQKIRWKWENCPFFQNEWSLLSYKKDESTQNMEEYTMV